MRTGVSLVSCAAVGLILAANAEPPGGLRALAAAYPEQIAGIGDNTLLWKDGTRMVYDDGVAKRSFEEMLDRTSLKDQMAQPYPAFSRDRSPSSADFDPGRARHEPFFRKMYGASEAEVVSRLRPVRWLGDGGVTVRMTCVNGADRALAAVSKALEQLDPAFRRFLLPVGGTFNWRAIAGTGRLSPHAFGIALDINPATGQYWRWSDGPAGPPLPWEIVETFERNGFIWGGRWAHLDSFHFEYRPELLPPASPAAGAGGQGEESKSVPAH